MLCTKSMQAATRSPSTISKERRRMAPATIFRTSHWRMGSMPLQRRRGLSLLCVYLSLLEQKEHVADHCRRCSRCRMAYRSGLSRSSVPYSRQWLLRSGPILLTELGKKEFIKPAVTVTRLTSTPRITSVYTAGGTISFMICGANSDLFGRRYFILFGNILVFVGSIVGATSHSINQSIVAHTLIGFGAGNCQLAAFALPELLPNKWRHFAVVIADGLIFFDVIVGPVSARIAVLHGESVSINLDLAVLF